MEDVLTVYSRPYDEDYPVVCMDEKPIQLFANARKGFRSKNGRTEYEDYEYIRNGKQIFRNSNNPAGNGRGRFAFVQQLSFYTEECYTVLKTILGGAACFLPDIYSSFFSVPYGSSREQYF